MSCETLNWRRYIRDLPVVSDPHINDKKCCSGCWHMCLAQWLLCHVYYVGHDFLTWITPPPPTPPYHPPPPCVSVSVWIKQSFKKRKKKKEKVFFHLLDVFWYELFLFLSLLIFFAEIQLLFSQQICLMLGRQMSKEITQGRDECVWWAGGKFA